MYLEPKVDSIYAALRQRILDGEFGKAGRLPSFRMLANQYRSTHETMNKVIQRLQAEGLLTSPGRAGVFVNFPRKHIPGITSRFDRFLAEQTLETVEMDLKVADIVPAPAEVANVFDIDEGARVVRRYRRQGTTTEHLRLAENYYPVELAGGEILEGMRWNVHFDALAAVREAHHKAVKRVHENVFARLPTLEEQALLEIVRNAPVFEILRTSYTADEKPTVIMYNRVISVASFFVLSYDYDTHHWRDD